MLELSRHCTKMVTVLPLLYENVGVILISGAVINLNMQHFEAGSPLKENLQVDQGVFKQIKNRKSETLQHEVQNILRNEDLKLRPYLSLIHISLKIL